MLNGISSFFLPEQKRSKGNQSTSHTVKSCDELTVVVSRRCDELTVLFVEV